MPTRPVSVLIVDDQAFFRTAARAVLDIHLPGISGIEATRRIRAAHPQVAVVLLSTYKAEDLPADARSCGALAYLNKEDFQPEVLERIWVEREPAL
jgi:two-component system invasion response regulator UvrY